MGVQLEKRGPGRASHTSIFFRRFEFMAVRVVSEAIRNDFKIVAKRPPCARFRTLRL
jgi:hypothetical protein